jgi:hypothetical protein
MKDRDFGGWCLEKIAIFQNPEKMIDWNSPMRKPLQTIPGKTTAILCTIDTSVPVKVFECRPLADDATHSGGRRRKTSKGGNRGKDTTCWCPTERCLCHRIDQMAPSIA